MIFPPTSGKNIIKKLIDFIKEDSFPDDDEKIFNLLSSDHHLGKSKYVVKKNFCILLLKKLFKNNSLTSQSLIYKNFGCLKAIERLSVEIYKNTLKENLNKLISNLKDEDIKINYWILEKDICFWNYFSKDIKTRFIDLIKFLKTEEIIKYQISKINICDIKEEFLSYINSLKYSDQYLILKETPSEQLKLLAIDFFTSSGTFNQAYENGLHCLLPHARYFNENDLRKIFEDSITNNINGGMNQIFLAHGIDQIFCQLFEEIKKEKELMTITILLFGKNFGLN